MNKLVETMTRVLSTKTSEILEGKDAEIVFEQFFQSVQQPLKALQREQQAAAKND